jgi:hypothetical protein
MISDCHILRDIAKDCERLRRISKDRGRRYSLGLLQLDSDRLLRALVLCHPLAALADGVFNRDLK